MADKTTWFPASQGGRLCRILFVLIHGLLRHLVIGARLSPLDDRNIIEGWLGMRAARYQLVDSFRVEGRSSSTGEVWTLTFSCTDFPPGPFDPGTGRDLVLTVSEKTFRTIKPKRCYTKQQLGVLALLDPTAGRALAPTWRGRAPKYG
jgi:hypothetical protein